MLGKLMKYEWKAGWKIMLLMNLFTVLMTVLGCFSFGFLNFEDPSVFQVLTFVAVLIFYILTIYAVSMGCMVYIAVRFYKNIYSTEGYLMHTLPVSPRQLLLSKLIVNSGYYIFTSFVMIFSIVALFAVILAKLEPSAYLELAYGMKEFEAEIGMSFVAYLIFLAVTSVVGCISGILMIYASIALGQLASKHKVLTAIGAYIALTTVMQIIVTIGMFAFMMGMDLEEVVVMPMNGIYAFTLVISIVLAVVFYILTEQLMKRKLNLE